VIFGLDISVFEGLNTLALKAGNFSDMGQLD